MLILIGQSAEKKKKIRIISMNQLVGQSAGKKKKIRILSMNQLIGQSAVKKKKIRIANQKPFYYCAPGTVVSEEILQRVEEINETYSKLKDLSKYMQDFADFFKLEEPINTTILKMFFTVSFVGGYPSGVKHTC
jgi:Zn finger protein HypA/HybF involved in hydrogenase expression